MPIIRCPESFSGNRPKAERDKAGDKSTEYYFDYQKIRSKKDRNERIAAGHYAEDCRHADVVAGPWIPPIRQMRAVRRWLADAAAEMLQRSGGSITPRRPYYRLCGTTIEAVSRKSDIEYGTESSRPAGRNDL